MNDTSILFGTDAAAPNQQIFSFHDLSFTIEALSIKNICVEDTEILREIAFLVRDADWGTVYPRNVSIKTLAPEKQELIISARFRANLIPFFSISSLDSLIPAVSEITTG